MVAFFAGTLGDGVGVGEAVRVVVGETDGERVGDGVVDGLRVAVGVAVGRAVEDGVGEAVVLVVGDGVGLGFTPVSASSFA